VNGNLAKLCPSISSYTVQLGRIVPLKNVYKIPFPINMSGSFLSSSVQTLSKDKQITRLSSNQPNTSNQLSINMTAPQQTHKKNSFGARFNAIFPDLRTERQRQEDQRELESNLAANQAEEVEFQEERRRRSTERRNS